MSETRIVVQTASGPSVGSRTRTGGPRPADVLRPIVEGHGLTIEPMHPGVSDPLLESFFVVRAPDEETAERVALELRGSEAVEAAYIKPRDEAP